MKNDWILDVLADLKSYAELNALPQLAETLSDVAHLAAQELSSPERKAVLAYGDGRRTGRIAQRAGGS